MNHSPVFKELTSSRAAPHAEDSPHPRHAQQRPQSHSTCFVCSPHHTHGLRLQFIAQDDGFVADTCTFGPEFEGYPGVVHGGILAAALDGAMTNWLFQQGCSAVTAELKVRYLRPVESCTPVLIRAAFVEGSEPLYRMRAELLQNGLRMATATAKFISNASSAKITEATA